MKSRSGDAPEGSLEAAIGYRFRDPALAELALSHPSFSHELDGTRGNERLEFLGDAVLDLAIGELLFRSHPDWREGELTRSRAALVNQRALADAARRLGLDRHVKLGRTEQRTDGARKSSVLANCFEAIAGAIYLDGGLSAAIEWVERVFAEAVSSDREPPRQDSKTLFQEWAHARFRQTPVYRTVRDSGTDNDEERFEVEVLIDDAVWGRGVVRSKRRAESRAAGAAMDRGRTLDGDDAGGD